MKTIISTICICFFSINLAFCQNQNQDNIDPGQLFQGFDQEITKIMEEFQWALGESGGILDTLDLQHFDIEGFSQIFPQDLQNDLQLNQMMELLQDNMGKMQELDMAPFQELLKEFDMNSPLIPAPELSPDDNTDEEPKKKSTKKRKLYKL